MRLGTRLASLLVSCVVAGAAPALAQDAVGAEKLTGTLAKIKTMKSPALTPLAIWSLPTDQ